MRLPDVYTLSNYKGRRGAAQKRMGDSRREGANKCAPSNYSDSDRATKSPGRLMSMRVAISTP